MAYGLKACSCHPLTFLIATLFVTEVPSFWTRTVTVPSHDQAAVAMSHLLTSSWAFPNRYWLNGVNCSCIPMLVPLSFLLDFISSDLLLYLVNFSTIGLPGFGAPSRWERSMSWSWTSTPALVATFLINSSVFFHSYLAQVHQTQSDNYA